jgi:hypothetical protein
MARETSTNVINGEDVPRPGHTLELMLTAVAECEPRTGHEGRYHAGYQHFTGGRPKT